LRSVICGQSYAFFGSVASEVACILVIATVDHGVEHAARLESDTVARHRAAY
jgi:hypothetical protein